MGKLKEKLSCLAPPSFGIGLLEEIHPLVLCVQDDNPSLKTMLSLLDTILADIASPDQGIVSLALRSLAYVLHIEKLAAEISGEIASTILSSLCQLVIATDKKATCSLAIWCLSVQKLPPQLVEMHLPRILEALMHAIEHPKSPKSLIHEALQALAKIAQSFSSFRTRSSLWAPAVYRHLLSADKKDREIAEQCMKDLKSTLLPPQLSLSKVVAVDINEMLLPKMERMVKSKALVLPTVRAWGWFVRLLGGLAGENRTLVNQLLKIVEVTFTSQDTSVRMASLVAWEALIDALLQSSIISVPENGSIQTGVNFPSLSSGEHEKSHLAPPLKRLKLLMVPLISITINDKDQTVRLACWRTWSYLAQKLGIGINQVSVVNIVVTPIFEAIFKNGPDKGHPSAWDSCLNSLEGWICCKVQDRIDSCLSQTLCMDTLGKVPSPKTPTCQAPESLAETSSSILWAPWSLDLLDVLLKLVKVLWNTGVKSLKTSCISYLSLNGALRMFRLLVKGVESDGKGAVKPLKQHIDSVHLLLMFLSNLSSECVSPACSKDLLSAVWSLIESLMDLQPLVLSSSFYKLAFASVSVQGKPGQCCSTSREVDNGRDQQEVLETRSCESVTPIVYIIAAWLRLGVSVDFAGPDGFFFKNKVASLVISATSGINILGNLQGIAIVLDWFHFEVSKQNTVSEDDLLAGHNVNKEARFSDSILQNCMCLLHSWSVFAEHTRSYLERANNVPAVEGGMGDSGYQVIFSFLLFPLQICMHLASLSHINNNNANFEASSQEFASDVRGGAFQLVCSTWVKLYDCASYISSRTSSQPNFFASGLSQKILKLLEKQWQQDGNNKKEAANGSSFLAEMLTAVVANVLKQTEVSNLAMLAINRKKRLGSFMGMSSMTNCARGSEADASTVRDILLLTSRILDISCDKFTAGQAYWLDSTARVLEEVARFTARLDSQHDVLVFLQDFSKPYAKWLKSTESFLCSQANVSSSSTALLQALQKAWQKHLHSLQKCHPPLAFDSNLLSLQAFALVPALQHSQTSISNCTVSFWEATYGSKAAALQYPPCMVPVLSQLKSKPGSNRGCAQSSRRKSDVSSYTYTGRRRLQMFQEHLVDTKKVPHCSAVFGPRVASCDEDITSQAVCPSLTGRTGNEESNAINTPANVIPETSRRPTGFATSAFTSMETVQSGLDTSQAHVSPSLDMLSKNGGIMQGANKESAATSTGNSTVAHPCLRTRLPANFADKTFQGNLTSSPPKCVLTPKRKNLRFSDLKTFAYASTPVPDEGRFPMTEEQSAFSPVKQRKTRDDSDNQSPNSSPSIIEATQTKMSFQMLNHSIGQKIDGVADFGTGPRKSKGSSFLRYSGEIKKLGIRQQRFLRSTGSLRGGKFWRDAAGAVKVLQKIKKQVTEATKNSPEAEMFSVPKVRKRGRPPLLRLMADETSAEEVKNYAVDEACDEKIHRKRGRPRRMGLINSEGALEAAEAAANAEDMGQQVKTSCEQGANAEGMGQQVQTSCEQGPNIDPSKVEKLLKKASMESPFRVQTLNRGIYGKIFSSIANHATAINNIASRSHHRKNNFPRRIPLSKDEQQEDRDLQESRGAHPHQKALGKRSKEAERYRGFEFATPSKILRSGKRLKSRKWEAVLAADKCGNQGAHLDSTLSVSSFLENYESLIHSRATASHLVNVGVGVENECSLFSLGGSGNPRSIDVLQAGNQPNHHGCQLGENLVFKQPPMIDFDEDSACPAGKTVSHSNNLSMATLVNKGSLAATTLCNELGFDRESIDFTKKRKLCDVLTDVSTSSEWNTMSLNDLDCAQKILSVLQDLVCESKKRALNKHAGNL